MANPLYRRISRLTQELTAVLQESEKRNTHLLELLEEARSYIAPTLSTHEEISEVLGWCDCDYCDHVTNTRPTNG